MTIAALRRLLDEVQPDVVRPPAPQLPPRRIHPRSKENTQVNAYDAVVRSMHRDGYTPEQISAELNVSEEEVTIIITAAEQDSGQTVPAPAPAPVTETMPEVAALLTWAAAHGDAKVRTDGEQAAAVLAALSERRTVDAELEKISSEEHQLEERLAALRVRKSTLQPEPAGAKRKRPERDYEPAVVRAWAREHGHDVPDRARIPKKVLEAWRQRENAPRLAAVS
ncbi:MULTISPECIES: histone-like nucleoid-structuring protein Lsr2 [unclassified Streptomyces]|uniref:Lsr2 family DNA-binding protein n=1 Tax=unclassified Streptomyces TaxID=2593676 RepID=UPI0038259EA6